MARIKKKSTDSVAQDAGASAPASFSPDSNALIEAMAKRAPDARLTTLTKKSTVITRPRFMSTQHVGLDAVLGGGIPAGRIVELYSGNEGSGKSSLATHILAECQRVGGIAVLIDTEKGNTLGRLEALGVDCSKLIYASPPYVEEVYRTIEGLLEEARDGGFAQRMVIVWDSIAATPTKAQYNSGYDDPVQMASLARSLSTHLPKFSDIIMELETYVVMINQSRANIGVMFGEKLITSGGKAAKFWASIRLKLDVKAKIKNASGDIDGIVIRAEAMKNKLAPPFRPVEMHLLFDRGIDTQRGLYDFLVSAEVITKGGAWNSITGCEKKFQYKDFDTALETLPEDSVRAACTALATAGVVPAAIQRYFPEYPFE